MDHITIFAVPIPFWIYVAVCFFLWVAILLAAKKLFFRWLTALAEKTPGKADNILISSLDFPLTLLIFAGGVGACQNMIPADTLPGIKALSRGVFKAAAVWAMVLFLDRIVREVMKEYGQRVDILKSSGGLFQGVIRFSILGVGVLILLETFGVSITPLWASLGIGSLGIALGLQPTLENFFSGIQIVTDGMIQLGQFIRLDSGEEGYVEKIGWRSTWIKLPPNNMLIVSNKTLANSKVLNYDYPSREVVISMKVGAGYDSNLARVEKITQEVAEATLKNVPGGVAEFKPLLRYEEFGDSAIYFTITMRAKAYSDQGLIKHEFIKRLHERYQKEGIVIPYPVRTIDLKPELAQSFKNSPRG